MILEAIGWIGSFLMLGGSILSIYKNIHCWTLWIIGGLLIIIECYYSFDWNIMLLQIVYIPLNFWGLWQWGKDDGF